MAKHFFKLCIQLIGLFSSIVVATVQSRQDDLPLPIHERAFIVPYLGINFSIIPVENTLGEMTDILQTFL